MPRELNPELFGPRKTSPSAPQMSPAQVAQAILGSHNSVQHMHQASLQTPTPPSVQEFEMSEQARRKIRDLENQVAVLSQKLEKLSSNFEQRIFQATQAHKALEAKMGDQFREMHEAQAAATSKITERRVADAKIQEMIDRHNQLVLQFEQRMNQIHKIASEQEMKIMTYQATIDEILREIRNARR